MTIIECELCEIDGEVELRNRTFIKLTPEMLLSLAEQSKLLWVQKLNYYETSFNEMPK